jgi:predicted esterase
MNISQNSQNRKLTEQEKTARAGLNHAISLHLQGNKTGALKSIRQALMLDPSLAQEKLTRNLAKELTSLPVEEAVALLTNSDASKAMVKSASKEDLERSRAKPPSISAYALVTLICIMIGMIIFGVVFRRFDNALVRLRLLQFKQQKHTLGDYDYYMVVPKGRAPEGGWAVVVGLHGYGGEGSHMAEIAKQFTDAGAIFVAPTFLTYAPFPGDGPIDPMSQILKKIAAEYPIQSRGAVLLGMSQGGSFAFRFSVYHPEQVYGVVTAGAPAYDHIFPPRSGMPYVFTWGDSDGLQKYVIPQDVRPLQKAGYNIKTYIISGYGHEMMPFAIEQALNMIR